MHVNIQITMQIRAAKTVYFSQTEPNWASFHEIRFELINITLYREKPIQTRIKKF